MRNGRSAVAATMDNCSGAHGGGTPLQSQLVNKLPLPEFQGEQLEDLEVEVFSP